jgi:hypothetical protein
MPGTFLSCNLIDQLFLSMEPEQKPKKHETHKNSLLSFAQEMELVKIIEDYLQTHGKPENADPIKELITDFCIKNGIERRSQTISDKTTYKFLHKHERLSKLYFPDRIQNEIAQEDAKKCDPRLEPVSREEYDRLAQKYNEVLQKISKLETEFLRLNDAFKSSFLGYMHQTV